jgi:hypothetical protein
MQTSSIITKLCVYLKYLISPINLRQNVNKYTTNHGKLHKTLKSSEIMNKKIILYSKTFITMVVNDLLCDQYML